MSYHRKTLDAARGKWKSILEAVGMPPSFLSGRNGPCPCCGGTDRWQWVNDAGQGGGVCRQCGGKPNGLHLLMAWKGIDWREAARLTDEVCGNTHVAPDPHRQAMTPDKRKEAMRAVWKATTPTRTGDVVDAYLAARGVAQSVYPASLRTATALRYSDGTDHPAMVALIVDGEGVACSLHRTFLSGTGKLPVPDCRKLMPGEVPEGACVRLSDWNGGALGIAEGIETALAASRLFELPVWACLNTSLMAKWRPPEGCDELTIFADHDPHFAGHRAAYILANNIKSKPQWKDLDVKVLAPALPGTDWNDELRGAA